MNVERIRWVDSGLSFASTWLDGDTVRDRARSHRAECEAAGFVVSEDERGITLCVVRDEVADTFAACFWIAKISVIERTVLPG